MPTKRCTSEDCAAPGGPVQPLAEFGPDKRLDGGRQARCKACKRRYNRKYNASKRKPKRTMGKRGAPCQVHFFENVATGARRKVWYDEWYLDEPDPPDGWRVVASSQ